MNETPCARRGDLWESCGPLVRVVDVAQKPGKIKLDHAPPSPSETKNNPLGGTSLRYLLAKRKY
jgi:hypothetical protein